MEFNGRYGLCDTQVSSSSAKAVGHLASPDQELEPSISVFGAESTTNKFWRLGHVFISRASQLNTESHSAGRCPVTSLARQSAAQDVLCGNESRSHTSRRVDIL